MGNTLCVQFYSTTRGLAFSLEGGPNILEVINYWKEKQGGS